MQTNLKRDPILHVKRSDLTFLLIRYLPDSIGITDFVDNLFMSASKNKMQLKGMYRFRARTRTKEKGERSQQAENTKVEIFNRLLASIRTKSGIGIIKTLPKTDGNYVLLKEITALAINFHEQIAGANLEQSFMFFIETGIELMRKKYSLSKFKYYKDKIYERYVVNSIIKNDNAPDKSKKFYLAWKKIVQSYAPGAVDIESEEDYADIVLARMEADKFKATYEDWITSQFEGLSFLDVVPNFNQLYGVNAKKRYREFINNKSYKKAGEISDDTEDDFETDEQKLYFEMLRKLRSSE